MSFEMMNERTSSDHITLTCRAKPTHAVSEILVQKVNTASKEDAAHNTPLNPPLHLFDPPPPLNLHHRIRHTYLLCPPHSNRKARPPPLVQIMVAMGPQSYDIRRTPERRIPANGRPTNLAQSNNSTSSHASQSDAECDDTGNERET